METLNGKILIDAESVAEACLDSFSRYNGGWVKTVDKIKKEETNGFSLVGDFHKTGSKQWYPVGQVFVNCSIGGSRKNQVKYYHAFILNADGTGKQLGKETRGKAWAVDLWGAIEEGFKLRDQMNAVEPTFNVTLSKSEIEFILALEEGSGMNVSIGLKEKVKKILGETKNE